jgi:dephospho-CoA kinase
MLADLGARLISADEIVHRMMEPGSDLERRIAAEFGKGVLTPEGGVDRQRLGEIVFSNREKRKRLEAIVHPPVLDCLREEIRRFRESGHGVLVVEVPLLVETSSVSMVDKVLVVTAEQETQIERLEKRYGMSRELALRRVESQLPLRDKVRCADWIVSTEGTLRGTKAQVVRVWDLMQKALAQPE